MNRDLARWSVTTPAEDDAHAHVVRQGYRPFTLDKIAAQLDTLDHGESITLTIVRNHDNAPAPLKGDR